MSEVFPFLGQRIKQYRESLLEGDGAALKIKTVAIRMGVNSPEMISMIENGKRNVTENMLYRILTEGFDMKPSDARVLMSEWIAEEAKLKYSGGSYSVGDNNTGVFQNSNQSSVVVEARRQDSDLAKKIKEASPQQKELIDMILGSQKKKEIE